MAILARQQCHILTFVYTNSSYNAAEFWLRVGDDLVNLFNGVTFAAPLCTMRQNTIAVRCRCGPGSSFNDIRTSLFRDRR